MAQQEIPRLLGVWNCIAKCRKLHIFNASKNCESRSIYALFKPTLRLVKSVFLPICLLQTGQLCLSSSQGSKQLIWNSESRILHTCICLKNSQYLVINFMDSCWVAFSMKYFKIVQLNFRNLNHYSMPCLNYHDYTSLYESSLWHLWYIRFGKLHIFLEKKTYLMWRWNKSI